MRMLSPHFAESEFHCKCGASTCPLLPLGGIDYDLVGALERIRKYYGGQPITINSGYRCPDHNKAVGGASGSRHTYGDAADFVVSGIDPLAVYADIDPYHHNGGLGRYGNFTHIDFRGHYARW